MTAPPTDAAFFTRLIHPRFEVIQWFVCQFRVGLLPAHFVVRFHCFTAIPCIQATEGRNSIASSRVLSAASE